MNIKGKGQRLIPEELLKYLEVYKENHPDPTAGGGATLDDIVDSHGNKRFIGGNLTIATIEGVTYSYSKWSLSGTHLMIVLVVSNSTEYDIDATNTNIFSVEFPEYINDKIIPDSTNLINKVRFTDFSNSYNLTIELKKIDGVITALTSGSNTIKKDKTYRVQFDLLIDAEYE